MDIVERLRGHAKGNAGGVKELLVLSAEEIERLRWKNEQLESTSGLARVLTKQAEEIKRLRQQNAELLEVLKDMSGAGYAIVSIYRAAIAKATGGE